MDVPWMSLWKMIEDFDETQEMAAPGSRSLQ